MKLNAKQYTPAETIKIIREWTGLTQKEFADSVGLSVSTIQGYEQGISNFRYTTLLKIARIHDVEIVFEKDTKKK